VLNGSRSKLAGRPTESLVRRASFALPTLTMANTTGKPALAAAEIACRSPYRMIRTASAATSPRATGSRPLTSTPQKRLAWAAFVIPKCEPALLTKAVSL